MFVIAARLGPRFGFTSALAGVALLSFGVGCDKKPPEPAAEAAKPFLTAEAKPASPAAPALPAAAGSAQQEPLHVTWVDPPAFKRVPPSNPMRKASFVVPRAGGDAEDGELTVFYFGPSQGGSIDANVERWVKQFGDVKPSDVKRADREANGLRQHTVELESGTFSGGMGMGPKAQAKPDYGLLGGIVEAPSGAYFFKLTGPSKTVKQARADFYKLLDSVKPS
ncbi:MAG TPA: hypothetical protein VEQ59_21035 [Polyangiaceae bacterium]|nr:hypothetical protein [Polyangiaceae bacterium]